MKTIWLVLWKCSRTERAGLFGAFEKEADAIRNAERLNGNTESEAVYRVEGWPIL